MGTLINCQGLSKRFGSKPLFDGLSLSISDGEQIGLIGPNGSGKSTLLRILAGREQVDAGHVETRRGARIAIAAQADVYDPTRSAVQVVAEALAGAVPDPTEREIQAEVELAKAGFSEPRTVVGDLSGGWLKRLTIVRAMAQEPDLLLLDEPTNHLDLAGVLWLEEIIQSAAPTFLVVTHDRYFLENAAKRIIEINPTYPGGHYSYAGNYSRFLEKRAEFLSGQQTREQALRGKVNREIEWMTRGRKAQTIKSKGRKNAAFRMIDEYEDLQRRNRAEQAADIAFAGTDRQTRKLLQADGITLARGGKPLFRDVDLLLSPGSRVGLLGPNGSGKSSLIQVLTKQLAPDTGSVRHAEALRVVVFDQLRRALDLEQTLGFALAGPSQTVLYQGRSLHVVGWAERFLFRRDQLNLALRELSGGEQARVQIAKLMLEPADVLILDEPTNDLDIPSLDVLEESVREFAGAVVLVTHDRYLMQRVCEDVLALDGAGNAHPYAGYLQWEAAQKSATSSNAAPKKKKAAPRKAEADESDPQRKKLTYGEKLELEKIEETIAAAEAHRDTAETRTQDSEVAADHVELNKRFEALHAAQAEVDRLYARWEELESRAEIK